jgi:hypothetical protein
MSTSEFLRLQLPPKNNFCPVTRGVTRVEILIHIAFDIRSIAQKKGMKMTALGNLSTSVPFTQLTFVFPETETQTAPALGRNAVPSTSSSVGASQAPVAPRSIPIGVAAPAERKKFTSSTVAASAPRRNKPEHISDLLLVVLDRYGIDANEFMAGLE